MIVRKSLVIAAVALVPAISFAQFSPPNPERSFDWYQYQQSVTPAGTTTTSADPLYKEAGTETGARLLQHTFTKRDGKLVHADAFHVSASPRTIVSARALGHEKVTGG